MERGSQDRRYGSRNRNEGTRRGFVGLGVGGVGGVIGTVLTNLYPGIGLGAAIDAFVGFSIGARDSGRDER